jgi:hypothetical protein
MALSYEVTIRRSNQPPPTDVAPMSSMSTSGNSRYGPADSGKPLTLPVVVVFPTNRYAQSQTFGVVRSMRTRQPAVDTHGACAIKRDVVSGSSETNRQSKRALRSSLQMSSQPMRTASMTAATTFDLVFFSITITACILGWLHSLITRP